MGLAAGRSRFIPWLWPDLFRFGEEPDLPQQAQGIEVRPFFDDLAVGKPIDCDARYLDAVARGRTEVLGLALVGPAATETGHHLLTFGHLVLYGGLEVGERLAIGGGELPGGFYAPCFSSGGLVEDVVGVVKLPGRIEIPP